PRIGSVVVDCNCYFKPAPNRSEETVLSTFQNGTRNASAQWLGGSYQLQGPVIKPVTQPPVSAEQETFRLNFTVTSLFYSSELKQPSSNLHRLNKQMIEKALDNIFRNSSIQKYFAGCSVESFRYVSSHGLHSTSRAFHREEVYEEFKRLTNGGTQLGDSYTLDKDSLLVNGEWQGRALESREVAVVEVLLEFLKLLPCCSPFLHKKGGLYDVQQSIYGVYFPHLDMRKMH
uniref:SEA domain-containing protein n=1 Tax=Chelonoidis abingdonii TaxID=106734 RepID=A0A8C0FVU9_CHEAB